MKKQFKFYSMLVVILILSFTLLACSKSGSSSNAKKDSEKVANLGELPEKFDEEVTLTTVRHVAGDINFRKGETIDDNVMTQWAKDKFNMNIKYLWTTSGPQDAFTTKMRLALSANEEMPDLIALRDNVTEDLIDSKRFMPVGELFEKYASDTWKKAMDEDPTVWNSFIRDGEKYAIPILDYSMNGDPVLFIREDWMKKLNLEAPKTLNDLENVMDAFANEDPDGNGKKDTFGLTIGFKNNLNAWMSDAGWVFGAYGAMPNQWNETEDGQLEHGSTNPAVKEGLAKLNEWMEKGYIHRESGLWDETKASELFTSGRAGIIAGPHWMAGWPLSDVKNNVEGAEFKAYSIPTGPDGKAGRHGTFNYNGAVLINKEADPESIKAFFVYQNYLFENFANPQAGSEFEYGFAEGYDYVMVDGEPSTEVPDGLVNPGKYSLTFDVARIPSLAMDTLYKLANGAEAETPFEKVRKRSADNTPEVYEAAKIVVDQKDITMPSMFTGAPTATMKSRGQALDKILDEGFNKIIYGDLPISEFETIIDKWKTSGGDKVTEEVNEWYKSVQ
ncbi:extracellular solute-binding protein [Bacillus sp. FSL K6-3431]|uniref:extracellular solute-binding protein n=1 Tax=Bacillus sp. FSL K6-3431 TaxID=2921500 RepID=UPI0030F8A7E0